MDGNGFTNKEVLLQVQAEMRDGFGELKAANKELSDKIDRIDRQGSIGTREELTDHENRLRSVEHFRFAIPTAGSLATIAAIVATIVTIFHG